MGLREGCPLLCLPEQQLCQPCSLKGSAGLWEADATAGTAAALGDRAMESSGCAGTSLSPTQ